MVQAVGVGGAGRAAEGEVPLEEVRLERGGGVVGGGGGGEFLGFADWGLVVSVPQTCLIIARVHEGHLRMRRMVGDLEFNFAADMMATLAMEQST